MGGKKPSGAAKRKKKREKEEVMERATAEMERLKLGPTALWTGLVLHHKDIFVSHVLPKLNRTDRYFFSEANSEGENLLKYAGVDVSELKWAVYECSSISTLGWAWNNMEWGKKYIDGRVRDQACFCWQVAATNKLEFLKWAREVKKCKWDERTIDVAADEGNLEMLKYCLENSCPAPEDLFRSVGHLDVLKFLIDEKKFEYDVLEVMTRAGYKGHLDILKYLIEDKKHTDDRSKIASFLASIRSGHLDCVKYFVEEMKMSEVFPVSLPLSMARFFERRDVLSYLREKDFPEPTKEEYADFVDAFEEDE